MPPTGASFRKLRYSEVMALYLIKKLTVANRISYAQRRAENCYRASPGLDGGCMSYRINTFG